MPAPIHKLLAATAVLFAGVTIAQCVRLGLRSTPGSAPSTTPLALMIGATTGGVGGAVSKSGDFTVLTFDAGNDDVLAVLDGRGETLYAYRIHNLNQFDFIYREDLRTLFSTGKRMGAGRVK